MQAGGAANRRDAGRIADERQSIRCLAPGADALRRDLHGGAATEQIGT